MDNSITVIQVLLTIFAAAAGLLRLATPYAMFTKLPAQGWAYDFQPWQIKVIGIFEIAAAFGIIASLFLPSLTMLTSLAAVGLALVMAGAMATHLRRSEYPNMFGNLVWLGLALFFAYSKLLGLAA
jgi:hypothetical protein